MAIQQQRLWLTSAPALVMYTHQTPAESGTHGTILFYHDHGASKEHNEADLARFAQAGFLAVGLDNVGHGERRYSDSDRRFSAPGHSMEAEFLSAVHATASEVPAVIDTLISRGWSQQDRIGIAGISMGGFITYAAIVADKKQRLCAATPILGSPTWLLPRAESPHQHPEAFFPTALLSQNAGRDSEVPASLVRDFHQWLAPYYASAPERLHYIEYTNADHELSAEIWAQVWHQVMAWFKRFLPNQ
ncbi:MAG TPA: dienelactone hydrolase family protein [Ktedonosporobacter sp.]|nr:dienelactone hydrolase family protein [Ktedonosporobacter sp.]